MRCEVSNADEVAEMVRRVVDTYGRLNAAFDNAGIHIPSDAVLDVPDEDYERVIAVNLHGV